jgi:CheY-like chemotaxis protein
MKILYVEDNDDNVYMLKNRLSRAGFTVVVATDGAQGIFGAQWAFPRRTGSITAAVAIASNCSVTASLRL